MCLKKKFPKNHHWNVIHFNKIQKKNCSNLCPILEEKKFNHVCHWKYFKNQLNFFPFGQISIKYKLLKLMFVECLKSSMG
jgi:hypothetical protein